MSVKSTILNAHPTSAQAALFYLGQETILIKCAGKHFLFDPYLTDYVDRNFSTEQVVWQRNYPSPISPDELDMIDYVFCSHDHGDHTDPETLSAIAAASPQAKFFGSRPVVEAYRRCGIAQDRIMLTEADKPLLLTEGITVTAIPAAHEELHPDGQGSYLELGFVVDANGLRFYHAGDCCPYDGLAERIHGADAAFMPINGRDYYRLRSDIIGNFDAVEAIHLAHEAQVGLLVPLHYDLYAVNCVNPACFVDSVRTLSPCQRFHLFVPGEKLIIEK